MSENRLDYPITSRMRPESDLEYRYPVADCPLCGEKDVPFGVIYFVDGGIRGTYQYCLSCNHISGEIKVKGYVSYLDLEDLGWETNL